MIEIADDVMEQLGQRLDSNTYMLDGVKYKLVRTHQKEPVSYYVEIGKANG